MNTTAYIVRVLLVFLVGSIAAFSQTTPDTGAITGVVKDPAQAIVSGTQVVLINLQTKAKFTTAADAQGVYRFLSLQPGAYVLEVDVRVLSRATALNSKWREAKPLRSTLPCRSQVSRKR
jgi:hypothetical protein